MTSTEVDLRNTISRMLSEEGSHGRVHLTVVDVDQEWPPRNWGLRDALRVSLRAISPTGVEWRCENVYDKTALQHSAMVLRLHETMRYSVRSIVDKLREVP